MNLPFNEYLKQVRLSKTDEFGKKMSQEKAARLLYVSNSTYRNWESSPPRSLPDTRSRMRLEEVWPEIFNQVAL